MPVTPTVPPSHASQGLNSPGPNSPGPNSPGPVAIPAANRVADGVGGDPRSRFATLLRAAVSLVPDATPGVGTKGEATVGEAPPAPPGSIAYPETPVATTTPAAPSPDQIVRDPAAVPAGARPPDRPTAAQTAGRVKHAAIQTARAAEDAPSPAVLAPHDAQATPPPPPPAIQVAPDAPVASPTTPHPTAPPLVATGAAEPTPAVPLTPPPGTHQRDAAASAEADRPASADHSPVIAPPTGTPTLGAAEPIELASSRVVGAPAASPARAPAPEPAPAMTITMSLHPQAQAAPGTERLTLHLTPRELGTVSFDITQDDEGRRRVAVAFERAGTMALFQQDRQHLEAALERAGISADAARISFTLADPPTPSATAPSGTGPSGTAPSADATPTQLADGRSGGDGQGRGEQPGRTSRWSGIIDDPDPSPSALAATRPGLRAGLDILA